MKSIGKSGTFNIGSGIPNSVIDLAESIVDSTGSNCEIVVFEQELDQVRQMFCSIEKAQIELGYSVNYPLKEGIKSYVNFLCSQVHRGSVDQ